MIFSRRRRKRRSAESGRRRSERRRASGRKPAKQSLRRSAKPVCVLVCVFKKRAALEKKCKAGVVKRNTTKSRA